MLLDMFFNVSVARSVLASQLSNEMCGRYADILFVPIQNNATEKLTYFSFPVEYNAMQSNRTLFQTANIDCSRICSVYILSMNTQHDE